MSAEFVPPEPFVAADRAAEFLGLRRARVLELARKNKLPAHPIGDGVRRVWRFRLSELAHAMSSRMPARTDENMNFFQSGNPLKPKRRRVSA
jgi:hypothetical protein